MNTANKLTILRVIMVPFFMLALYIAPEPWNRLSAALIFLAAALTDMADGRIARKYDQITNFGKFLDPLADKLLVFAALLMLTEMQMIPAWVAMIIILRELMVTSLRMVVAADGTVIAAGIWGKLKTTAQIVAIMSILLESGVLFPEGQHIIGTVTLTIALILTVYSGYDYFKKYYKFIDTTK